ncbi:MAG: hypothetical protein M1305_01750 [Candidatus Marsarchaeota archaeon]|nr:hypothetical protein [Candidatus Marsarchaeota archaeon]
MRIRLVILVYFSWLGIAVAGHEVDGHLKSGVGVTTNNFSELVPVSVPLSVARSVHRSVDAGFVHGFVTDEDDSIVYSLSRGPALHAGDMETRYHIGSWPLVRWGEELTEEVKAIYNYVAVPWDPDQHQYYHEILPGPGGAGIGCLHTSPLRYGDIDKDGEAEVVLFLGLSSQGVTVGHLDMVVFSPEQGMVIFSARIAHADIGGEVTEEEYPSSGSLEALPQFVSSEHQQGLGAAGMQAYAKVFMGDFDEDGVHDIVVWRKRYEPLLIGDDRRGFDLVAEIFSHYRKGEQGYLPQQTPEAIIRSWLSSKGLTWQFGFPSYSECPGEEGQLIPEMHAPLLNDPDVLQ